MSADLVLMPVVDTTVIVARQNQVREYLAAVLSEGTDYAAIPGASGDRKELLQPGAEKVATAFGLTARFHVAESEVDHVRETQVIQKRWLDAGPPPADKAEKDRLKAEGSHRFFKRGQTFVWQVAVDDNYVSRGLYRYVVRCELWRDTTLVGEALGVCSSLESKYARSPRDAEHTILSMARKRAFVSAVRTVVGLSGQFTSGANDHESAPEVMTADVVDDVPEVTPEQKEANNQRQRENLEWLKTVGGTKGDLETIKVAAAGRGLMPFELIAEAREKGASNLAGLMGYVADGEVPAAAGEPAPAEAVADPSVVAQAPIEEVVAEVLDGADVLYHHGVNNQDCTALAESLGVTLNQLCEAASVVAAAYPDEWKDLDATTFEKFLRDKAEAIKGVKRGGKK